MIGRLRALKSLCDGLAFLAFAVHFASGGGSKVVSHPVSQLGSGCEKCQSVEVKVAGAGR